ncbi:putative late blight resistance protein homolog R1B-19 [Salvia splendens]|uniref:putative late blight resistance protein homolog R1B-19 n=1 Tax=Salvia splendens TaxID=180675 RepID=UPI001C2534EB|nr:putative late blight resistance protein homolog R1B-19 [Salvia splendens]
MYLMVSTRPDIAYSISCLSRYMSNPGPPHWEALKWLLRYLKHTAHYGLHFSKYSDMTNLCGFVDSNYANDRDKRKSTTSYVFTLGGSCVSWKSQLQHIVVLSTTESEYIAITEAMKEALWLKGVVSELRFLKQPIVVYSDSQSTIQVCKNLVFHDRTKHIDVRFHFIRDVVEKGEVLLEKIHTDSNPTDIGKSGTQGFFPEIGLPSLCESLRDITSSFVSGVSARCEEILRELSVVVVVVAGVKRLAEYMVCGGGSRVPLYPDYIKPSADLYLTEPKNYGPKKITSTDLYKSLVKVIKDLDLIKKEVIAIVAVKDQLQRQVSTSASFSTSSNKLMSCFNSWRSLQSNMEIVAVKYQPRRQVSTSVGSSSRLNNTTMVGSDDVMLQLMENLTYGEPGRQVIPIVGMAGIGKTTLATNVYAKPRIAHHFDICDWVTISQQYNTQELLSKILSQVNKEEKERVSKINEDEIGLLLHKHLSYRRYLIVLDDMWTIEAWEEIQCYFPDYGNGSRIVVTTRLSNLGSQLDSNFGIEIKFMDDESSWDLFCKIVFREKNRPLELEQIGKKIVKSCRGLPLSIVVMGGLLEKLERTEECWESLVNSQNNEHCLKILKLSYKHFPVYLKPCFLYMGTYEEDSQIRVLTIIKIWVSEGFLKPTSGKGLETIAREYLDELVDRNLVLVYKFGKTGNMKYCKIHDLFRDLCLREARKERFYHVVGKLSPQGTCSQRRVVIPRRISKKEVIDSMISTSYSHSCISDRKIVPMLYQTYDY